MVVFFSGFKEQLQHQVTLLTIDLKNYRFEKHIVALALQDNFKTYLDIVMSKSVWA